MNLLHFSSKGRIHALYYSRFQGLFETSIVALKYTQNIQNISTQRIFLWRGHSLRSLGLFVLTNLGRACEIFNCSLGRL